MIEILAEELLGFMQAGLAAGGARTLLVSYEAFATLLLPGVNALLKTLTQLPSDDRPSISLLLTSYGWENSFTHGDPTFSSAMVANEFDRVKITFPHTTRGLFESLTEGLQSRGHVNIIVAGKGHLRTGFVRADAAGFITYPKAGDRVVLAMGDLAANVALDAQAESQEPLTVIVVEDPRSLRTSALWDAVWPAPQGARRRALYLTTTYAWAAAAAIPPQERPFVDVRGWIDEPRPIDHSERLARAGITPRAVLRYFQGAVDAAHL